MPSPTKPSWQRDDSTVMSTLATFRIDFSPRPKQPTPVNLLLATLVSLTGSSAADAVLVAIGTRIFPATSGYVHFRFSDYGALTTVGVIIACVAWPVVTRISSAPHWVFLRMAVLVTAVLLLPDVYILAKGQPVKAVLVLMLMHLAIGAVTYNALVRLAPPRHGTLRLGGHRRSRW